MLILGFIIAICVIVSLIIWSVIPKNSSSTEKTLIKEKFIKKETKIVKHSFPEYEVLEIFNLLTPSECNQLIDAAKKQGMAESGVLNYDGNNTTKIDYEHRKSKTAWLTDNHHPLCEWLAEYSQKLTGIPKENQESLQVALYEPFGKFNEHIDACTYHDKDYCDKINRFAGQRRSTLLVYLNDGFTGGETEFVNIGLKIKPETGKAILFWNVDQDENILENSKHRGNPVYDGEKWICTKWSHVLKYP